jgi:oligopeptide/dipeptide ABC transporter ATP-binding protein
VSPLLEVADLGKNFFPRRTPGDLLRGRVPTVSAVEGVSFAIGPGESLGVVGESGCGKTTLGRLLLRLENPTSGSIRFNGQEIGGLTGKELLDFRRQAQLVFQNPFDALNPRFTIRRALAEPLVNTGVPRAQHGEKIRVALRRVHLPEPDRYLEKFPHELSGGQLQRVVLARALVLEPRFIVADEPVSMLDVSVRAGILNVLREVRDRLGLAALTISHDLSLVRYVCARSIVMYLGRVVEDGPTEAVVSRPAHPYTQALVAAVPVPHVEQSHAPLPILPGAPDARHPPSGCRFRTRCPHAMPRCAEQPPPLVEIAPGHRAACYLHIA